MWGPDAVSARRLRALVVRVPLTGALGLELGDYRATGWGNVEELLAALVEQVDGTNRLLFRVNTKKGVAQPKPVKVPRPSGVSGETEPVQGKKRPATSEELKAFFGGAVRYTGPRIEAIETSSSGNPVTSPGEGVE